MRLLGIGNRLRVGLVTVVVLVVGLVSATSGAAAPRDNIQMPRSASGPAAGTPCRRPTCGRSAVQFDCIVYALRGGVFATVAPPAEEVPPPPALPPAGPAE